MPETIRECLIPIVFTFRGLDLKRKLEAMKEAKTPCNNGLAMRITSRATTPSTWVLESPTNFEDGEEALRRSAMYGG